MKKLKLLLILFVFGLLAIYEIQATIINVPADFASIQEGINVAVDGDTVLVQAGIYVENLNFNGKNIVVGSLFLTTHDTAYISQTIIDGNENGSVVTFISGEELIAKIAGFTITNGYVDFITYYSGGAGIRCENSSPTIENNIIKENYCDWYTYGGGIYCENSNSHILNNAICYNEGAAWGGGIGIYGDSEILIIGNIIHNNITQSGYGEDHGGGIFCSGTACNCIVENTSIYSNIVYDGSGGGICCNNISSFDVTNVLIFNNIAPRGGGVSCHNNSYPNLKNVTISNNSANKGGGIYSYYNSNPSLNSCISWNNSSEEIYFSEDFSPNTITIAYSDIEGGLEAIVTNNNGTVNWLEGNIDTDPLFADPTNGNYHLTWTNYPVPDETKSPCIDTGDPSSPLDPDGTIADMGAFYFDQSQAFIEVSGPQSGVWQAGNTYHAIGDISVQNDDTLKIEPGVIIKFMDDYSFNICGSLFAVGTEADTIFFTSGQANNNPGDWNEIKFEETSNDNSIISYAYIEYANCGIDCYESFPLICNNNINNCGEMGIRCVDSYPIIKNNIISNNNNIGILCYSSSPNISNNTITNNTYGIDCYGSSPTINKNTIIENSIGINCYNISSPAVSNNTISNNGGGINCWLSSFPFIVNNILYENSYGINAVTPPSSLEFNLFFENTTTAMGDGLPVDFGEIVSVNANNDPCDPYMNLFMNPDFIDPNNFNFHLTENSPCIDAGNPDPIYYDPDGTVADIGAYYFSQSQVTQQITLSSGFSLISSRIIPENPDMLVVFEEILNENLDFVRNSLGQTLRKIGPNWVNGIGDWIIDEGYLVKMSTDDSFSINGIQIDPVTPIPVETGFQFISYFPENPIDALIAFETIIGDDLDFVRNSQGQTLRKIGPNWVNGIGDCQPGEGYLVKMFADGVLIYPGSSTFTCGDPFIDPRDKQTYETVQIGNQCWMAENLNIGTMINGSEEMTDNGVIEKYCYDNDPANCDEYGGLYQWNEMMEYTTNQSVQGVCPNGWHLPTEEELTDLTDFLGGESVAGGKMKETGTTHWNSPNTAATNESGFTALPGSFRRADSSFIDLCYFGLFWSSSDVDINLAWYRLLSYKDGDFPYGYYDKSYGFSSRCLQDYSISNTDGRNLFDNLSIQERNESFELSDPKRKSKEAVKFDFEGGNPAEAVYTLYIKGLNIGDEIAAFDGDILVGTIRINSEKAFENELPVFSTLTNGVGYIEGNPITFKVWSDNKIVSADFIMESIYDSYVSDVFPEEDGRYSILNITKYTSDLSDDLIVYPNPSNGIINIFSNEIVKKVEILNLSGQSINTKIENSKEISIDLSYLNPGVYFIRLYSITKIRIKKILID
ncbi:MAG: right-handed parallel beta-helix repeat-containing protein [Bacteroidales bacterium]|nr:right-handed parallel beta-helix repeat-containing protein [Bacteroidales bacterium]